MERQPVARTQEQQADDFRAWEQELATPETAPEAIPGMGTGVEHIPEQATSSTAVVIRRSSERIATMLDNGAETRAQQMDRLRRVGKNILTGAREISVITSSVAYVAIQSGADHLRQRVATISANARARRENRAMHTEALAMNERYDQHTEALAINQRYDQQAEAQAMNERYDQHVEALAMNEQFDENKRIEAEKREKRLEALAKAKAAYARKMERRDRIRNKYDTAKEKGGVVYEKAKRGIKRFGRAALRTALRIKRAGAAAREAWNQQA